MFSARVALSFLLVSGAAVAQQYVISTVAGGAPLPTPIAAASAGIPHPLGMATDPSGRLYFVSDNCVFRINGSGTLTRIAGNSRRGYSGDGGPAVNAQFSSRLGAALALDTSGNLYIADQETNVVRKITSTGIISSITGLGAILVT